MSDRKQHRSLLRGQRTACRYKPRSRDLIITVWVVSSLQCRSSELVHHTVNVICHSIKCTNWRFSHAPRPGGDHRRLQNFWDPRPCSLTWTTKFGTFGGRAVYTGGQHAPIQWTRPQLLPPRAGSGVVRIDPHRFLAGCRKRRLNQAPFVLSLNLGLFWCMCCAVN